MCTKNEQKVNYADTSEVVNMVGYIAHTLFVMLDSMKKGIKQFQSCSAIHQSTWRWLMIRILFVLKWVNVYLTGNCKELSGLREDIARSSKFINGWNRKIKHWYVQTNCYSTVKCLCNANAEAVEEVRD